MSQEYEFYYSAKAEERMKEYAQIRSEPCIIGKFRGQKFVECVNKGQEPVIVDEDLVSLGFGTLDECSYQ